MDWINEKVSLLSSLKRKKKLEDYDELYELIDIIAETSGFHLEKLQEEYLRNLRILLPHIEKMYGDCSGMDWPYQAGKILEGTYPLSELPEHLRPLAEKLYYSDEK